MKIKTSTLFLLLILISMLIPAISIPAQAGTRCVENWPNNIWEESVPEEAVFNLGLRIPKGNETVEIGTNQKVWAVTVPKLLPVVQSELTNAKGSIAIKQELLTITPDWKIGSGTKGQAFLAVKSGGSILSNVNMPPFEWGISNARPSTFVPNAILRVRITVSAAGCTPRVFISPSWQNKNYQLPKLDSPEVASWESNFDFASVSRDKNVLISGSKILQVNYEARLVQFQNWNEAGDFTQCGGVFPDSDLPRTSVCQVNFYANYFGMFIHLGQKSVNMNAIGATTKDASKTTATNNKKTSITCVKGKLTKTVTAVKPVCPAGYKKK